jgi:N-acyl-L-homoserine lactone synthetase
MLRYVYGDELYQFPKLRRTMFLDRADQFKVRLGWDVSIDSRGYERDAYDDLNPLYVIWEQPDGSHGGSMRFLPTTGRVMVNDHFSHLMGGGTITSPLIWECTRFCLSRDVGSNVAAALMLAGGEIMNGFGIRHFVGVFDARMIRIYRMTGSSPEVIGTQGQGREAVSVGLWEFNPSDKARIAARAGLSEELSRLWFDRAFGRSRSRPMALSA